MYKFGVDTKRRPEPLISRSAHFVSFLIVLALNGAAFGAEFLSVRDAHKAAVAKDLILVDVRRPDEWKQSGVPESAALNSMHQRGFLERLDELTGGRKNAKIALICATGGRTTWLSTELEKRGYTNLYNVREGMFGSDAGPGWLAAKLPTKVFRE